MGGNQETKTILKFLGSAINLKQKTGEVSWSLIQLVQQTMEGRAIDWIEVFKLQFHYELQRIKLEVQGPKPVIIHTILGAHISLLLSTTNSLALAKSIKK